MKSASSAIRYRRVILSFVSVLIICVVIADVVIHSHQRSILIDLSQRNAQNELDLIGTLVREALLKRDYRTVEDFLVQWGTEHSDVLEIRAVMPNGFVLAEYTNPVPTRFPFRMKRESHYLGRHLITLDITKDFAVIEKGLVTLSLKLAAGSAVFIAALGVFLWQTLKQTAVIPLERLNRELSTSNDEFRKINEELKNFVYIVSHDMRAPLVSIKGFTGELERSLEEINAVINACGRQVSAEHRERLAEILQQDVAEDIKFIGSAVSRIDGQINAILALSRLGQKALKPEPVNMEALVRAILSSLAHQIEQRRVTVTVGEMPAITADRISLEQIMGNLLDNAVKYLDPRRDGEIAITAEEGEAEVTVRVRDNGRGIAGDDIRKVFDLFRRAGRQDVPGEGAGLAYVKTLVHRHGGRIWCESRLDVGTTFTFTIPGTRETALEDGR